MQMYLREKWRKIILPRPLKTVRHVFDLAGLQSNVGNFATPCKSPCNVPCMHFRAQAENLNTNRLSLKNTFVLYGCLSHDIFFFFRSVLKKQLFFKLRIVKKKFVTDSSQGVRHTHQSTLCLRSMRLQRHQTDNNKGRRYFSMIVCLCLVRELTISALAPYACTDVTPRRC